MAEDTEEASSEVIGTLVTVMAAEYVPYLHALKETYSAVTTWAQHIEEAVGTDAAKGFYALGIATIASATAAVVAWERVAELVTSTAERAERIGTSAGYLSQWNAASILAGKGTEEFAGSIESLHNRIREMSIMPVTSISQLMSGSYRPFTMLGLNPFQMRNMSSDDQMMLIADRLSLIRDKTLQLTIAQELFGDSAFYMLEYLKKGREGVEELKAKMESFNVVLTEGQAEAIKGAVISWRELRLSMQGVFVQIASALAPAIHALTAVLAIMAQWFGWLLKVIPGLKYVVALLGVAVIGLFSTLVIVIGAMIVWGAILPYLTTLMGYLSAAVWNLSFALMSLNDNPIIAVITLIALAILAVLYFTGALGKLKDAVSGLMHDTTHELQANSQMQISSSTASPETSQILRDIANSARGQLMTTKEMVEELKKAGPPHMAYSW